jgi:phosphatidylethanolamine N-methyltransferase
MSSHDTAGYKISILPNRPDGSLRFQLGEPIRVDWKAPDHHSHGDWIGIYRVRMLHKKENKIVKHLSKIGANKTNIITKTSSLGMWVPVHDDEWDGDIHLGPNKPVIPGKDSSGTVVFKGDALPWLIGRYEVRSYLTSHRWYTKSALQDSLSPRRKI